MFEDTQGVSWDTSLNGFLYVRLKRELDVDVFQLFAAEKGLPDLLSDIEKLVDALWMICEKQAVERGVEMEAFLERLGPQSIATATESLLQSVMDFLPTPEQREAAWAVIERAKQAGKEILQEIPAQLQSSSKQSSGQTQG